MRWIAAPWILLAATFLCGATAGATKTRRRAAGGGRRRPSGGCGRRNRPSADDNSGTHGPVHSTDRSTRPGAGAGAHQHRQLAPLIDRTCVVTQRRIQNNHAAVCPTGWPYCAYPQP
jgi:hypothetical protein